MLTLARMFARFCFHVSPFATCALDSCCASVSRPCYIPPPIGPCGRARGRRRTAHRRQHYGGHSNEDAFQCEEQPWCVPPPIPPPVYPWRSREHGGWLAGRPAALTWCRAAQSGSQPPGTRVTPRSPLPMRCGRALLCSCVACACTACSPCAAAPAPPAAPAFLQAVGYSAAISARAGGAWYNR